jgi:hypothetical protein
VILQVEEPDCQQGSMPWLDPIFDYPILKGEKGTAAHIQKMQLYAQQVFPFDNRREPSIATKDRIRNGPVIGSKRLTLTRRS